MVAHENLKMSQRKESLKTLENTMRESGIPNFAPQTGGSKNTMTVTIPQLEALKDRISETKAKLAERLLERARLGK
jgi:hypothetical protein